MFKRQVFGTRVIYPAERPCISQNQPVLWWRILAEVGMEVCVSAHHWSHELQQRGFRAKLIAARFVKPYVKSNKNGRVDAEAIREAMGRPRMQFVSR